VACPGSRCADGHPSTAGDCLHVLRGNQLQAFDVRNGDVVWQEEIPYVDDIRFTAYDGFCYVYGTEAPVQAFAGERGRVLTAVHNAEASDNSLSGTIAGALGWRDSLAGSDGG